MGAQVLSGERSTVCAGSSGHNFDADSSGRIVGVVVGSSEIVVRRQRGWWGGKASSRCHNKVGGHDGGAGGLYT